MKVRLYHATRTVRSALFAMFAVAIGLAGSLPADAVQPDEILSDPALEARARAISSELRCLVCQNQSIDDSNAPLARDLRLLVRERLKANDTDQQVRDYIVARYGDFVLLKPPFNAETLVLWLTPLLVLLGGIWLARRATFKSTENAAAAPAGAPLSAQEMARLEQILKKEGEEA